VYFTDIIIISLNPAVGRYSTLVRINFFQYQNVSVWVKLKHHNIVSMHEDLNIKSYLDILNRLGVDH